MAAKSLRTRKLNRIEPILACLVAIFHMYMWRLAVFATEKEKPETMGNKNSRHCTVSRGY